MGYPNVDFLFLNEEEMIKAGVKDMPLDGAFSGGIPISQYAKECGRGPEVHGDAGIHRRTV